MKKKPEFQWDYSYFKWQNIPVAVRREMIRDTSMFGRTWIRGRNSVLIDVFKQEARRIYNHNWDGCRDLWKENYRKRKLAGLIEPEPKDPKTTEWERDREQARRDAFNRNQQKRYERWLKKHKPD